MKLVLLKTLCHEVGLIEDTTCTAKSVLLKTLCHEVGLIKDIAL